jgi:multidrug efflux pump subunit AcrA (membrane-fusion protein)
MTSSVETASPAPALVTASRWGRRRLGLGLAGVAVLAAVGAYLQLHATPAKVTPVVRGSVMEAIYATGTVEAEDRVVIKAKTTGSVTELLVREGATVKRGDLLARIDNPTVAFELKRGQVDRGAASAMAGADSPQISALKAQTEGIRVDLATARQDVERLASLAHSNAIAPAELDRARSRAAQLEAKLSANEAQERVLRADLSTNVVRQDAHVQSLASRLADTEVRSPIDGVVLSKSVAVGELVSINQPLFKVGDTKSLVLEVSVDEADVSRVFDGSEGTTPSKVAVSLYAFPKQAFHGQVLEIMPDANRERKAFLTKVRIEDAPPGLRSGMSAEVNVIAAQQAGALLIPTAAESEGKVWVVEEGRAHRRAVTTGIRDLLRVEVKSGVSEGDLVVVEGIPAMREGARVAAALREPDK